MKPKTPEEKIIEEDVLNVAISLKKEKSLYKMERKKCPKCNKKIYLDRYGNRWEWNKEHQGLPIYFFVKNR